MLLTGRSFIRIHQKPTDVYSETVLGSVECKRSVTYAKTILTCREQGVTQATSNPAAASTEGLVPDQPSFRLAVCWGRGMDISSQG